MGQVGGRVDIRHRQLEEFRLRVTQHALDFPVGEQETAGLHFRQQDAVRGPLEQDAEVHSQRLARRRTASVRCRGRLGVASLSR